MPYLRFFFLTLCLAACLFMLAGLIKPWMMLWWEELQNRRKVIKVYGSIALVSLVIYFLLRLVS